MNVLKLILQRGNCHLCCEGGFETQMEPLIGDEVACSRSEKHGSGRVSLKVRIYSTQGSGHQSQQQLTAGRSSAASARLYPCWKRGPVLLCTATRERASTLACTLCFCVGQRHHTLWFTNEFGKQPGFCQQGRPCSRDTAKKSDEGKE